jgi:hydroxyacylglutathione hydrolase
MILQRLYDERLAQASYLVGCAATGEAAVIDPGRDPEPYVRAAAAHGLTITAVTETHIHADFVSGARELAARTGARLYLSDEGGPDWRYGYAEVTGAVPLKDGDTIRVGNLVLQALHTPGHTPEHLAFLLTDTPATDRPMGAFTGDFVFVGDVGRPDLLERAARVPGSAEAGARTLFRSLQRFKRLPDYLQIWPGHGAGSACGKGLSAVPQSTLGYERIASWAFAFEDEDGFVRAVLDGQPEAPTYFGRMKRVNRDGPRLLGGFHRPERLPAQRLSGVLAGDGLVVDTRHAADFASGHVPGTLNIPLDDGFVTWAGWLLPEDRPLYLLVDDRCPHCLDGALVELAKIGLDRVAGYFGAEAVDAWSGAGHELARVGQVTPTELAALRRRGEAVVVDVRGRAEWEAGHIPGVPNIPLGYLADHLEALPRDRPLVVLCQSGARSAIAASLLRAHGFGNAANLQGGLAAWRAGGNPVEPSAALRLAGAA